jgi:hypothetical protein
MISKEDYCNLQFEKAKEKNDAAAQLLAAKN